MPKLWTLPATGRSERLAVSPPTDIDEFAEAALAAEGYGFTKGDSQAREVVAQAFIEHQAKN
jgi:hypothetical protein